MSRFAKLNRFVKGSPRGHHDRFNEVKFGMIFIGDCPYLDVYRAGFINNWVPLFKVQEALEKICPD